MRYSLLDALQLPERKGITALVGGGGKTSLMMAAAAEYAGAGLRTVVTTTTRIAVPEPGEARVILAGSPEANGPLTQPGEVTCVCALDSTGKLRYPGDDLWERICREADLILDEADGAKRLPVKAPAAHEPVIPPGADAVVAVAGLTALGRPIRDTVFRWELACRIMNASPETLLKPEHIAILLTSPEGQMKGVEDPKRYRIFLNQADSPPLYAAGLETARQIRQRMPDCRIVIGTLRPQTEVRAVLTG